MQKAEPPFARIADFHFSLSSSASSSPDSSYSSTLSLPAASSLLPHVASPGFLSSPSKFYDSEGADDQDVLHEVEDGFARQMDALERVHKPSIAPGFRRTEAPFTVADAAVGGTGHSTGPRQPFRTPPANEAGETVATRKPATEWENRKDLEGGHGAQGTAGSNVQVPPISDDSDDSAPGDHASRSSPFQGKRRTLHSLRLHTCRALTRHRRFMCLDGFAQSTAMRRTLRCWRGRGLQAWYENTAIAWADARRQQRALRWWWETVKHGEKGQREAEALAGTRHALSVMSRCWKRWKTRHRQQRQHEAAEQARAKEEGRTADVEAWRRRRQFRRGLACLQEGAQRYRKMLQGQAWGRDRQVLHGWMALLRAGAAWRQWRATEVYLGKVGMMAWCVGRATRAVRQWRTWAEEHRGARERVEAGDTGWQKRQLEHSLAAWRAWTQSKGCQGRKRRESNAWWYLWQIRREFHRWRGRTGGSRQGRRATEWRLSRGWRVWRKWTAGRQQAKRVRLEWEEACWRRKACQALRVWEGLVRRKKEERDRGRRSLAWKCSRGQDRCLQRWARRTMIDMWQRAKLERGQQAYGKRGGAKGWEAWSGETQSLKAFHEQEERAGRLRAHRQLSRALQKWTCGAWERGEQRRWAWERGREAMWQWKERREAGAWRAWKIWAARHRLERARRVQQQAEARQAKLVEAATSWWRGASTGAEVCTWRTCAVGNKGPKGRRLLPPPRPWTGEDIQTSHRGIRLAGGTSWGGSVDNRLRNPRLNTVSWQGPIHDRIERDGRSSLASSLPIPPFLSSSSSAYSTRIGPRFQPRRPLELMLESYGVRVPPWIAEELRTREASAVEEEISQTSHRRARKPRKDQLSACSFVPSGGRTRSVEDRRGDPPGKSITTPAPPFCPPTDTLAPTAPRDVSSTVGCSPSFPGVDAVGIDALGENGPDLGAGALVASAAKSGIALPMKGMENDGRRGERGEQMEGLEMDAVSTLVWENEGGEDRERDTLDVQAGGGGDGDSEEHVGACENAEDIEGDELDILEARLRDWMMERERFEHARKEFESRKQDKLKQECRQQEPPSSDSSLSAASLDASSSHPMVHLDRHTSNSLEGSEVHNTEGHNPRDRTQRRNRRREERMEELRDVMREYVMWQQKTMPLIKAVYERVRRKKLQLSEGKETTIGMVSGERGFVQEKT